MYTATVYNLDQPTEKNQYKLAMKIPEIKEILLGSRDRLNPEDQSWFDQRLKEEGISL